MFFSISGRSFSTFLLACLMAGLWSAVMPASAQNVRWESSGYGLTRRQGDNAADKQNRADWPRIADGDPGTQVHVSFDLGNADVVLMTGGAFGQQPLLAEARKIAPQIGRPRADYILFTGTKTVTTDIELNKYLVRPDKRHTQSDLDLSALAAALDASSLPRPVVIFVNAEDADTAALTSAGTTKPLSEATFFGLNQVPPGARLHFTTSIPWYAPLLGLGLAGLILYALGMMTLTPWRLAKKRREQAGKPQPTPNPEEVQKRYDKQKPVWLITSLFPMAVVLLTLLGNPHRLIDQVFASLPFTPDPQKMFLFPLLLFAPLGLSSLACALVERRRARNAGTALSSTEADPDAPPAWTNRWFFGVMTAVLIPMLFLSPVVLSGLVRHMPWLRFLPFGLMGLMAVGLIIGGWLSARATRKTLPTGDPWYEMVHEVAAQAGVKVRHVVRVQSSTVNAYASIFGTVGLTAGLLRKMEPDEVRAVVAHEIGHFRGGHVRRGFIVSLLALAAFWALWWFGLRAARPHLSDAAYALLSGPMVGIFIVPLLLNLLLGRGRRRREAEADRFAVEATGDPELVIATLTKLHTLNASPHRLKPSDELLSSHPSLINRIEAIRTNSPAT